MPTLTLHPDQPFDLDATLACGQVFRWDRSPDGWWSGVVGNNVLKIRQDGEQAHLCRSARIVHPELFFPGH